MIITYRSSISPHQQNLSDQTRGM